MPRSLVVRRLAVMLVGGLLIVAPSLTPPASAQEPYVGVAFVGSVVRTSGLGESDGETPGWSLRVGTPIGERWGVDAEFVYPGRLESDIGRGPLLGETGLPSSALGGGMFGSSSFVYFPYEQSSSVRHSTLNVTGWVRQRAGDRVELMYLGGVAFGVVERNSQVRYLDPPLGIPPLPAFPGVPIFPPTRPRDLDESFTRYEVGPTVGMDARIRMTDQLRLVPGIRLTAFSGTLIARPAVGLHWVF